MANLIPRSNANDQNRDHVGLPVLLPLQLPTQQNDSGLMAVNLTPGPGSYAAPQEGTAWAADCPEMNTGNASSTGGIRIMIPNMRSPSERSPALPPPTYEEAVDPNALPPPAYESLFGQVQAVGRSSDGVTDFVKNLTILLFGTIGCVACIGLAIVIPVAMIVIGALYFNECPRENKIPLYLVVGGAITLLNNLFGSSGRNEENNPISAGTRRSPAKAFVTCFMFVWFVLGSIWVYKEYEPSYDPTSPNYCNPTLYLFAFWVITSSYLVLMLISMSICCIACLAAGLQSQIREP